MSRSAALLTHAVIVLGALLCAAVMFDTPHQLGQTMNADTLLPFSIGWDITHQAYGWRGHDFARIPSFLPDLTLLAMAYAAIPSLPWSLLLYGAAQLLIFIWLAGALAARLAGSGFAAGCAMVFALFCVLALMERATNEIGLVAGVFVPLSHVGPFLFSLVTAWLAIRQIDAPTRRRTWLLAAAAAPVFLSDRLLVVEMAAPLVAGCAVLVLGRRLPAGRAAAILGATAAGALAGLLVIHMLDRAGIRFERAMPLSLADMGHSTLKFLRELPAFLATMITGLIAGGVVPMTAFLLFPLLILRDLRRADPAAWERIFLWCFAATSIAGCVVFTAAFYNDPGGYRYLIPAWVWPLIFLAALLLRSGLLARASPLLATVAACAFLFVFTVPNRGGIALLRWDDATAACLRPLRGKLDLRAGLAGYWEARPIELATDWTLQVDQITEEGYIYAWGNDVNWYRHSLADPKVAPDYNFIVMRMLYPDRIRAMYGPPDEVAPCGDTEVWVYRTPGFLRDRLLASSPHITDTFR
jgi:hypothetical protein